MRARIYDSGSRTYFVSEVYGIVNFGGDRYIVSRYIEGKMMLCLVDYLDFKTPVPHRVNVECIDCNPAPDGAQWVYRGRQELEAVSRELLQSGGAPLGYFRGYPFLLEQDGLLVRLIRCRTLTCPASGMEEVDSRLKGWNYIEKSQDIRQLMEAFAGFHDSVIREIHYISGDYLDGDEMCLTPAGQKEIRFIFDSQWSDSIEVVFQAVRLLQLVPPGENYLGEIFEASVFIRDYEVYFYDGKLSEIPAAYEGTWIRAMGMRWRYYPVSSYI